MKPIPDVARVPLPAERFRFLMGLARRGAAQMMYLQHETRLREAIDARLITCIHVSSSPAGAWVEVDLTPEGRHLLAQDVAWQKLRNEVAWYAHSDRDIVVALQANTEGLGLLLEPALSRAVTSVRRGFPLAHAIATATDCRCYCEWCAR